jgi:hypothetical protein
MVAWHVNGVDLARFGIQRESVVRPPLTVRHRALMIPGVHGTVQASTLPVFDEPVIGLDFLITGPDTEQLADELVALFGAPHLIVEREMRDVGLISATALLVTFAPGERVLDTYARFRVVLAIPGVFFYGSPVEVTLPPNAETSIELLEMSTAPILNPIFRLQTGSAIQITDTVNRTGLSWSGTIPAGHFLFLDSENLRSWVSNNPNGWHIAGGQHGVVDYPVAGRLQLWPQPVLGELDQRQVRITVAGTGLSEIVMRTQPSFL